MTRAIGNMISPIFAAPALFVLLAACGPSFLSGASSMRIEVEVYKGPLSRELATQTGELRGLVKESIEALDIWCLAASKLLVSPNIDENEKIPLTHALVVAKKLRTNLGNWRRNKLYNLWTYISMRNLDDLKKAVEEGAAVATRLKTEAFVRTFAKFKGVPENRYIRSLLTDFVIIASEISNQILARVDVILRQVAHDVAGSRLSTGDFLRDSSTTDFLNLYDWFNATLVDEDASGLSRTDKVRLGERLFADHYWSKINTVYASGQGDVNMAFVKDDIGNWNLKSYSNDPAELLKSYTNVGKAVLGAAINIASGGAGSVASAAAGTKQKLDALDRTLALGRKIAFGEQPSGKVENIEKLTAELRAEAIAKLRAIDPSTGKKEELEEILKEFATQVETLQRAVLPPKND